MWNPMSTAPRDGTYFLAKIEWEDVPVVACWLEGRNSPSVDSTGLDAQGGWDGAIIVQWQSNVFIGWLPLPEYTGTEKF